MSDELLANKDEARSIRWFCPVCLLLYNTIHLCSVVFGNMKMSCV